MKSFLEEYGFAILAAIVVILLIAMATPVGDVVKKQIFNVVDDFGSGTNAKLSAINGPEDKNITAKQASGEDKILYTITSDSSSDNFTLRMRKKNSGGWSSFETILDDVKGDGVQKELILGKDFECENGNILEFEIIDKGTGKVITSEQLTFTSYGVVNPSVQTKPSPYREAILAARKLYDVGEKNLKSEDIVTIDGVPCYVLKTEGDKAEMITVNLWKVLFAKKNTGSPEEYHYDTSNLRAWMDTFYQNNFAEDEFVLETDVNFYYSDTGLTDITKYDVGTVKQHVFALDALEAKANYSKFGWDAYGKSTWNCAYAFGVTAGMKSGGTSIPFFVTFCTEFVRMYNTTFDLIGARPVFWVSIAE